MRAVPPEQPTSPIWVAMRGGLGNQLFQWAAAQALDTVQREFGRVDALLNIAGAFVWQTIADGDAATWDRMYELNVKTALKLAHVRGVALLTVAEAGIALGEYSPAEIKNCVVGYGRAEKQQVQLMVRSLTGMRGEFETEDASDAVAVAICHATLARAKRLAKVAL